ncbi:pseudouridine synthase [Lewinellaceae bacterium SD302]|nr:pseudouridine synthase [Lewinellaceae bacterium SD302]
MHYFIINKPYGMLSQFTREADHHRVLGDLHDFPKSVYPVGRLDRDSEGLLILTDDKQLHTRLLNPKWGHQRSYWVQVEGIPGEEAMQKLRGGVPIRAKKKSWTTLPARAELLGITPVSEPRDPPVRVRQTIPDSWLELTLTEGKNRQVRRMCAAVGFPVLRLIRHRIEGLSLEQLSQKPVKSLAKTEMYASLGLST